MKVIWPEIRKEKYVIFMPINIIMILPFHSREVKGCIKGKVVNQDVRLSFLYRYSGTQKVTVAGKAGGEA